MSLLTDMSLSEAQLTAVLDDSPKVLVSAGAGSGKTRLLVAYFIHALVHEEVPPEDLVAVTFTRKAAAELTERIRAGLLALGRDDLVSALDKSTIGTIHRLCSRLVKADAFGATVDPAFSVIDPDAAVLLKKKVLTEAWEREVEEADEERLLLLASYERLLKDEVIRLYDRLREAGQYSPQVDLLVPLDLDTEGALVAAIAAVTAAAGESSKLTATQSSNLAVVENCLSWLQEMGPPESLDAMSALQALRESAGFLPKGNNSTLKEQFDSVKQALAAHRTSIAQVILSALAEAMNPLLACFHHLYSVAKCERGVLDFADLELRAKRLSDEEADHRAAFFGPRARIMVDEFQDTNRLQCDILEGLGASRILMVGDDKQSIYRFRGADVAVFQEKEAQAAAGAAATGSSPRRGLHRLATNYRSSEAILTFVNGLFAHPELFGPGFTGLEHGRPMEHDRVRTGGAVDVIVAARSAEGQDGEQVKAGEAEARVVAQQVRALLGDGGWRPRDIAILVPALTHSSRFQEALGRQGVETYLVRGKGYYSMDEVSDIRSLLQVMVDPRDDLALLAVLRSPFVQVSDDTLYHLGRIRRKGATLWEAVTAGEHDSLSERDRQAVAGLAAGLATLKTRVGRPGLARLIDDAVSEFSYDVCALLSEEGGRRFANMRKLMGLADQYESLYGPDLAGFVEVMKTMGELSDAEGNAPTLAEDEDVVRMMTIHQAKGLEFPVVVLTGLTSPPLPPKKHTFMLGADGATGAFLRLDGDDFFSGSAPAILEAEQQQESQEDLRRLYVAMTRAQDRLVIVGSVPDKSQMRRSRIMRILRGLGMEGIPEAGTSIGVDVGATVSGVLPTEEAPGARPEAAPPGSVPPSVSGAGGGPSGGAPAAAGGPAAHRSEAPGLLPVPSLTVLPRRLSFSALHAFGRCPRQFYLERGLGLNGASAVGGAVRRSRGASSERDGVGVGSSGLRGPARPLEGLREDEELLLGDGVWLDDEESHGGLEVGLLVHSLLEGSVLHGPRPERGRLRELALEASAAQGMSLSASGLDRALDLTEAFWRSPVATAPGLAQARKEESFLFSQEGVLLSGVVDLVWRQGGSWSIVDFKTNALGGRTPDDVAADYELQACVYCLGALKGGAAEVGMALLFLERPEAPVRVEYSSRDRERLEARLTAVLGEIRNSGFPAVRGVACTRCGVAALCR